MRILAICAHPDDIEFLMAGTLLHLRAKGHTLIYATMAKGDLGSAVLGPEEISAIRLNEARDAAARLGAEHHCLGFGDLAIFNDDPTRRVIVEFLRQVQPEIILTASVPDYMPDHELCATIARECAFTAPIPNYKTGATSPAPPLAHCPHVYYCDPVGLIDWFGNEVKPQFVVDVSTFVEEKSALLACHTSQREWLRKHHGVDEYLNAMRGWGQRRGRLVGVAYAEGFRQHLGHGYPEDNVLAELLGCPPVYVL